MQSYILRRLLLLIPIWLGVSVVIFSIMRVLPGDPAAVILGGEGGPVDPQRLEEVRHALGFDRPLHEQYIAWMSNVIQLDFGDSYYTGEPVGQLIARRIGASLQLAVMSLLTAIAIAVPSGVYAAHRHHTKADYLIRSFAIVGLSVPNFWLGIMLFTVIVPVFAWSPPLQYVSIFSDPVANLQKTVWPMLILGYTISAPLSRITWSSMLEVRHSDFVRTARSKGLRTWSVLFRHALPNALLPLITITGIYIAALISGVVIMETLFNIPGLGFLLVDALIRRDFPIVEAVTLLIATIVVMTNLVVDILYAWTDPRIRYD